MSNTRGAGALFDACAPALFVILWSSGFIGAKLGVGSAEPFTVLLLRFSVVLIVMLPLALLLVAVALASLWLLSCHAVAIRLSAALLPAVQALPRRRRRTHRRRPPSHPRPR